MIEFGDCSASRWGCWRCGGTFTGIMPYTIAVRPDSRITGHKCEILSAGICRNCMENDVVQWALPLFVALRNGEPVWWKLRVRLAWMVLRGKLWERREAA